MDSIKAWVIDISTTIILITAIELIIPKNSMKKYVKFVLGLILISVIINPIIKFFNNKYNFNTEYNTALTQFNKLETDEETKSNGNKGVEDTQNKFKENLKKTFESKLKEKYPGKNFSCDFNLKYDEKKQNFIITKVMVDLQESNIDKVKRVTINPNEDSVSKKNLDDSESRNIKEYLSKQIGISENIIEVYKG